LRDARENSQEVDKIGDLTREVIYKMRVVVFYDVLGWKEANLQLARLTEVRGRKEVQAK
jgi:hypothetical protein